jgi:hypothetical protein
MLLARRGLIGGTLALLAAPAIIRTPGLLMPVRPMLVWARFHQFRVLPRTLTGLGVLGVEILRGDEEYLDIRREVRDSPDGTRWSEWRPYA